MIKVKHPLEKCNNMQLAFIITLPSSERRNYELVCSYGNAAYAYHYDARHFKPTISDFEEWLTGLPENVRIDMGNRGFEGCLTVLSFTRYVNEKNDLGFEEFIKALMGEEEFNEYKNMLNQG